MTRQTYSCPFADWSGWLDFIRKPPDESAAAEQYAGLISADQYARYAAGTDTHTERITYRNDGLTIGGVMVSPRTPGRHPVIIYNHGNVMDVGRIILAEILEFNRLAERGYIVLASTYRGAGGSEGQPSMDGGDVSDSLALIRVAEGLPDADPTRIGMWGFSRGGFVTYGALARTNRIAAAVIQGGPADLVHSARRAEFDTFVYPHVIRDYARDRTGALARLSRSNGRRGSPLIPPSCCCKAATIPASHPRRRCGWRARCNSSYRLKLSEGGSHDLFENYAEVRSEMDRWFDRYVRDRLPAPAHAVTTLPAERDQ